MCGLQVIHLETTRVPLLIAALCRIDLHSKNAGFDGGKSLTQMEDTQNILPAAGTIQLEQWPIAIGVINRPTHL